MRVWYDQEGDFLEIIFRDAKGYLQEIDEDVYERLDEDGGLLGYAIFNVSRHDLQPVLVPLGGQQLRLLATQLDTA